MPTTERASEPRPLPDAEARQRIREDLDRSLLVEAAAGTGKTTSMVARMVALLRAGKCTVATLAAVTFTRKPAAELRARFHLALEHEAREARGEERARLASARASAEQCFVGTIHAFCARLLRERPIEGGVDFAFEELDEVADARLRDQAWNLFRVRLLEGADAQLADELDRVGLATEALASAFADFATYPDIAHWSAPHEPLAARDIERVARELEAYASHIRALLPRLPDRTRTDRLIPAYRRIVRMVDHAPDLRDPVQLAEVLEEFDRRANQTQKEWMRGDVFTREEAKAEAQRWEDFRAEVASPFLERWRATRCGVALRAFKRAREIYDALRAEQGRLNYADLLLRTAALLRESRSARDYFARHYTHLLVDEFQDTDPVQAEILFLLTAQNRSQTDWRHCRPRPGALFVVGDPKQSIYRFRRADIVTYNLAKSLLHPEEDTPPLQLRANFRAVPELLQWTNRVFEPKEGADSEPAHGGDGTRFPAQASEASPGYVPLAAGRATHEAADLQGVYRLDLPEDRASKDAALPWEAARIAALIQAMVVSEKTVPGPDGPRPAHYHDFLLLTWSKKPLLAYARALQDAGVPHEVTGGATLAESAELRLLWLALRAVTRPDDALALVAVLRSELFGVSDAALYALVRAGGTLRWDAALPQGLDEPTHASLADALEYLRRIAGWLDALAPGAAVARITDALGLAARAACRPDGEVAVGALDKALDLLTRDDPGLWSCTQMVEHLDRLVHGEEDHDAHALFAAQRPMVRVMNLHKAKGLEAPVVFLASPTGLYEPPPHLHVDRSGKTAVGHLAVFGQRRGPGGAPILAHPPGWAATAQREQEFLSAEMVRLRYVAATRAAGALVVAAVPGGRLVRSNPWQPFAHALEDAAPLPDFRAPQAHAQSRPPLGEHEPARAAERAEARLASACRPTYGVQAAKAYALAARPEETMHPPTCAPPPTGEHGVEWGAVIHRLLELAAGNPDADLRAAAADALAEHELDVSSVDAAVETVTSVQHSHLWARARKARRLLVEVPFETQLSDPEAPDTPLLVRGVVDLAFREAAGWVLVDYKTDLVAPGQAKTLAERYAPQLGLYARAWTACTGEPVRETGLYFTRAPEYVRTFRDSS